MRRTKAQAEATRQQILDSALKLFDEQGYIQTSLSMIARDADVTRGAIYWHFQNKEEILQALAEAQFSGLMAQNAVAIAAPDTWKILIANFTTFFRDLGNHPAYLRFFRIIHQQSHQDDALAQLREHYNAQWQQQCREAVARGKANGELAPDADPEYLFFHISAVFCGLIELYLDDPQRPEYPAYSERTIRNTILMLQMSGTSPNNSKSH